MLQLRKSLIVPIFLIFCFGCISSQDPKAYNSALIAFPAAMNRQYSKFWGAQYLNYFLSVQYPASGLIKDLSDQLEKEGWKPLKVDFLNPDIPSSTVRGWTDFIDGSKKTSEQVHQWAADWENKNGDLVTYFLSYRYPMGGPPDWTTLEISAAFFPVSTRLKMQKQASKIRERENSKK